MRRFINYINIVSILLLASCSTTKHLPEGEILYTGLKSTIVENRSTTPVGETAMEEVNAALAKAPNNSLLGSSSIRTPFPIGLWFYSGFQKYKKGMGHWMYNKFAATPVTISSVNPGIRKQAAENVLRDYGYFNGKVSYETFISPKDSLKAKLQYTVDMRNPYYIDTITYQGFTPRTLRIMEMTQHRSLISPGTQFNVTDLDAERARITTLMRNIGCYYFRSDYMIYQADTTMVPGGHVQLRLVPVAGMPEVAEKSFHVGKRSIYLAGRQGETPNDSIDYQDVTIHYYNKLGVRPNMLYRWINYYSYRHKRQLQDSTGISRLHELQSLYSLNRQNRIQERLGSVGIFRSAEIQYIPRDTAYAIDTLDVNFNLALDKPYDAELDFNVTMKSNNQTGPGAAFILTKKNVFGGGESWNVELDGSYEWQTGGNGSSSMNSYEVGLSTSLTFPRVVFPHMGGIEYDFPATSTFRLYIDQTNRARYYKLLAFGGNITYEFQPKTAIKHSITPFRLTFNMLRDPTDEFLELEEENPALYISLRDQFIPAMEYTFTYDNTSQRLKHRLPLWWQTTLTSAGNITSAIYRIFGKPFDQEEKKLFGVPFAQFLKINSELRYLHTLSKNQKLAARIAAGVIWSYGNTTSSPYTEQFYIGGANSVRAFAARSIGPGGYPPDKDKKYTYINHVGDIRFEANVEYRFRIISDLHGALFVDAGNTWLLRKEEGRPNGEITLKNFPKQIALGTGFGVRYDLDFLVFRLDMGIGLHAPYETSKSGYYNFEKFKDGMAIHFAVGYPF